MVAKYDSTLPVTMEVICITPAVSARLSGPWYRGSALHVYQCSPDDAVRIPAGCSRRRAQGVKLEEAGSSPGTGGGGGGFPSWPSGLTQSVHQLRLPGAGQMIGDAVLEMPILEEVFSVLGVRLASLAAITALAIPNHRIRGPQMRGRSCPSRRMDVRTLHAKFVKKYAQVNALMKEAAQAYITDVRKGAFPGPEHSF